jgi:hypothetical protein
LGPLGINATRVLGETSSSSETLVLDGQSYVQSDVVDELFPLLEYTISVDAYAEDWSNVIGNQIVGNWFAGGFEIEYNNGIETPFVGIVPECSGHIITFNVEGNAISQKAIIDLSPESLVIDRNLIRWIANVENNRIDVFDTDNVNILSITLSGWDPTTPVLAGDVNENNEVYFLFGGIFSNFLSGWDLNGSLVGTSAVPLTFNNFTFDLSSNIVYVCSNPDTMATVDCQNRVYHILGGNLYRDNQIFYHIASGVSNLAIDAQNNIWITHDNRVLKIDSDGNKIFERVYNLFNDCVKERTRGFYVDPTWISFTRELDIAGINDYTWILSKNTRSLTKLDADGNQLKCISLPNYIDYQRYDRNSDEVCFDAIGDFTGYDPQRKYNKALGNGIIKGKVQISEICNPENVNNILEVSLDATTLLPGWHTFTMSFNAPDRELILYVDGVEKDRIDAPDFPELHQMFYRYKAPLIIGANSGKFSPLEIESGLTTFSFLQGQVDTVRFYDRALKRGEVSILRRRQYRDMDWTIPTGKRSYVEQIEKVFQNRFPPFKSNTYDLNIKNLKLNDTDLETKIGNDLKTKVHKIAPKYTSIRDVIFLDE